VYKWITHPQKESPEKPGNFDFFHNLSPFFHKNPGFSLNVSEEKVFLFS